MKTSSYFTYTGEGRIAISRGIPRQTPAGYRIYRQLAPGSWFNSVAYTEYRRRFFDQLSALNPSSVWSDLHELSGESEPVLLCYERPPFSKTNFCHRRMVAEWFEKELGFVVPELGESHMATRRSANEKNQ